MFFAKLHPLLVHFPMALLFSGTLFQLFGAVQKEETILTAGNFNILFGFWSIPVVMAVGGISLTEIEVKGALAKDFLFAHILYAFLTFILFAIWMILQKFRGKFWADLTHYIFILAGMASVFITGFYGGELVHRFGLPEEG